MFFFFQAEDGIRDTSVTGVQTCALPICRLAHVQNRQRHDLPRVEREIEDRRVLALPPRIDRFRDGADPLLDVPAQDDLHKRSEERRVGKECRYRWWA